MIPVFYRAFTGSTHCLMYAFTEQERDLLKETRLVV